MDQNWLQNLTLDTAIIVPTRSLANHLLEQLAQQNLAEGKTVWEAKNILVWQDYLNQLWLINRAQLGRTHGARTVISSQQSLLLWTQVIESSRRREKDLTLLNVQQTARAVQRSWKLLNDWRLGLDTISQDHVADTDQMLQWITQYQSLLESRGLLDTPRLMQLLVEGTIALPYQKLIWYCYDLVTAAQQQFNRQASAQGVEIEFHKLQATESVAERYLVHADSKSELRACFKQARQLVEHDHRHTINIVIPDLAQRQSQVRELAREVFYPSTSPLDIQSGQNVYRFSLGQPLSQWAAIETALGVIKLLKNHTNVSDLGYLLRNNFLRLSRELRTECRLFERWLRGQRYRSLSVDSLPDMYQHCLQYSARREQSPPTTDLLAFLQALVEQRQQLQATLTEAKINNGFSALSFSQWVEVFTEWLTAWGWHTEVASQSLDSVQYQLHKRWFSLLEEFALLSAVQKQVGLNRAIEILQQMTRDAVFLPKAAASPVFISGIYEAIGRPAQTCFLTGMDQDYPSAPQADSFLPNRLLADSGYPEATAEGSFALAKQVSNNLIETAQHCVISYARLGPDDDELLKGPSPLFRDKEFRDKEFRDKEVGELESRLVRDQLDTPQREELECYIDSQGPPCSDPHNVKGGSRIFENQSNCEFKAFVTHQLEYLRHEEAEFGLDALDHGNVIHMMLDRLWARLENQQALLALDEGARQTLIEQVVDQVYADPKLDLSAEKITLLRQERLRHIHLLKQWLCVEEKRCQNFTVIEREEHRLGEVGGIRFDYAIDRLDMTDDGRTVIIDYKTGDVSRNDWLGERIKSPQMPLYSLALDQIKRKPVSGIALAKVRTSPEYLELSEAGIFRDNAYALKHQQNWLQSQAAWPQIFDQLAKDFLAGKASINPIDEQVCRYCELTPVCRVQQLRADTASARDKA